jgi:hypothetical protein
LEVLISNWSKKVKRGKHWGDDMSSKALKMVNYWLPSWLFEDGKLEEGWS